MTTPTALLARLVAAGTPADLVGEVALLIAKAHLLEERKANDRERKERQRATPMSREVTGQPGQDVTSASRAGASRAEPETTLSEETQKQESKKASKSTTPAASRGTRLPADFVPDIAAAVSEGLPLVEAEREAEKFRDWWLAAPGSKGLKANWPATWRTWFRKRIEERSAKTGPPRKGPSFRDIARATDAILKETATDARTPPYLRLAQ